MDMFLAIVSTVSSQLFSTYGMIGSIDVVLSILEITAVESITCTIEGLCEGYERIIECNKFVSVVC